jgi:tetratricopeptide (TPR) repeat protein
LRDWKDFAILDTIAAAYAEAGKFDKAVEWQEKAIKLAPDDQKEDFGTRLKLYQEGKPYREEPKEK